MSKEMKGQKGLPDFVLVRYYRHVSVEDHLKKAGLPATYVQQNSMWTVLGVGQDSRFKKANYIGLSLGEVIGDERELRERAEKPAKEKQAKKEAKKLVEKPAKKNGKKPPLKVKNSEGKVVEVA